MPTHWILLLGDISVTESAACIPPPFQSLISNLKGNTSTKYIVCTGNLGSDGAAIESYLLALLQGDDDRLIFANAFLNTKPTESSQKKVTRVNAGVVQCCNLRIGICNGYQFLPMEDHADPKIVKILPSAQALFNGPVDLIFHSHTHTQQITRTNDGIVLLSPGTLTGKLLLQPRKKTSPTQQGTPPESADEPADDDGGPVTADNGDPVTADEDDAQDKTADVDSSGAEGERPSFTLLNVDETSITVYNYVLDEKLGVQVSQIDLGHPRPIEVENEVSPHVNLSEKDKALRVEAN